MFSVLMTVTRVTLAPDAESENAKPIRYSRRLSGGPLAVESFEMNLAQILAVLRDYPTPDHICFSPSPIGILPLRVMLFFSDAGHALALIKQMFLDEFIRANDKDYFASVAFVLPMLHQVRMFALSRNIDPAGMGSQQVLSMILLDDLKRSEAKGTSLRRHIDELEQNMKRNTAKLRKVRDAAAEIQELREELRKRDVCLQALRARLAKTDSKLEQVRVRRNSARRRAVPPLPTSSSHRYSTRSSGSVASAGN